MSKPRQLIFPFSIDKKSSISKFFISKESKSLVAAIEADEADDILLIGRQGVGKSYLLQAICNDKGSNNFSAGYIPLGEAIKHDPMLLDGLESLNLVCVDDLQEIVIHKDWQIACFNLINRCNESGCRLIFSCNEGVDQFFPDLSSRLKKMTNYQMNPVQDSELSDAIRMIASNLRIPIDEKEINFLLNSYTRDLADLISFIKRIDEYSMGSKRRITIPLIKELM